MRGVYLDAAREDAAFRVVDCCAPDGSMETPERIFSKIEAALAPLLNAPPMRNRAFKWLSHACRIVLGVTFIFSGFVKTVDPWGTAIKIQEYLSIYGLESLSGLRFGFSIWLCGAELMMGLMLLFKVRIRLISIFALASMIFFTVLTFLSATWLPVEDCGCFGDAVKLTPWETFAKNLVLLPLSVVVWWRYRRDRIFAFSKAEVGMHRALLLLGHGAGHLLLCASAADRFQTLQGGGEYLRGDERLFGGPRAAGGEDGADLSRPADGASARIFASTIPSGRMPGVGSGSIPVPKSSTSRRSIPRSRSSRCAMPKATPPSRC